MRISLSRVRDCQRGKGGGGFVVGWHQALKWGELRPALHGGGSRSKSKIQTSLMRIYWCAYGERYDPPNDRNARFESEHVQNINVMQP